MRLLAARGTPPIEKFTRNDLPPDLEQNYAGKAFRYEHAGVTIDLLPGVVRNREADVDVPEW